MGKFAKRANELLEAKPDWQAALTNQKTRLSKHIPTSEEEAQAKASANVEALKEQMYSLGYILRAKKREAEKPLLQDVGGGMPGREVVIDLPAIKRGWYAPSLRSAQAVRLEKASGVVREALAPLGMLSESMLAEIAQTVSDKARAGQRVTSDPSTLTSYYPQMAIAAPKSFHEGYTRAEKDADVLRLEALKKEVDKARKEYERALSTEYATRGTAKTAGELIDGLAQHHVKCGDGELNQLTGAYLALATLLGYGSHEASKAWISSRDPRQQKFEAIKEELRKKRMRQPSPILVEIPEPVSPDL